jgi:hypothetical protein
MTTKDASAVVDRARDDFVRARLELVRSHGPEAFDQGHVLYVCGACAHAVVVRDNFYGARPEGPVDAFLRRLESDWWRARASLAAESCPKCGAAGPLPAVAAFYGRYLGEVGFDYGVELSESVVRRCWRMDARARVSFLRPARDEGELRDQTGTFFDLRAGWRWLLAQHRQTKAHVLAEVQTGYVIGARMGGRGDPAERDDPALDEALAGFERGAFDVLEFLAGDQAREYPFHGERYGEWLGEGAADVDAGKVELFVLADSSQFLAAIEDLGSRRGVAVEWIDPEEHLKVAFHLDDLRLEASFAYPLLRSLHTGRTFVDGTRAFYLPLLDALEDARDLVATVRAEIDARFTVAIDEGTVMVVRGPDGEVGRWNLMAVVGRQSFRGAEGTATLLKFLGYDRDSKSFSPRGARLDRCPACGGGARVGKVIRPLELLGVDPRMLVGMPIGQHIVYYTIECPLHATPVEPGPGHDLQTLEAAYRDDLDEATGTLLEVRPLGEGAALLVGFDAGSLVLEPARLRAALKAANLPDDGQRHVYAFFPDALVVADGPLTGPARHAARVAAMEAVLPRFPARTWPLDVARPVKLDADPAGRFEVAS